MVLRYLIATFAICTFAAHAAKVAAGQEGRETLNIDIPPIGGGGTGRLIVRGGDKQDIRLDDLLVGSVGSPE